MRRLLPTLIMVLVLAAAAAPAAQGVERWHGVYRGKSVRATFAGTDGACLATEVGVFALASTIQWLPGTPYHDANLWIAVAQVDTCTGREVLRAYGYASGAAVAVHPSLRAGAARASLQVYDWVSFSWLPVEVDLAWAATGDPARERAQTVEHGDRYVLFAHHAGTIQPATAAGGVTLGGANLAAAGTDVAEIVATRDGELFVAPHNDPD